jgi:DNA-binding NtrC family response regulator
VTRVLVVDDDSEMRAVVRDLLQRGGFEVFEESSGEPIVSGANDPFDVIIVDKEMPGINGLDLLSFVRHRYPAVPVILITAFGGPRVAAEAFDRGATRYLEKPFRMGDLLTVLQSVVAERTGPIDQPS